MIALVVIFFTTVFVLPASATIEPGSPLRITSVPSGANVSVDGRNYYNFTTPASIGYMSFGPHLISLTREGYRKYEERVEVGMYGRLVIVNATLVPDAVPGPTDAGFPAIGNICSTWHLWCNHLQETTKETNTSVKNEPDVSQIIRVTDTGIQANAVPPESDNLSSAVVQPGDMVGIDLEMGDIRNNISIHSLIILPAGNKTRGYSLMPGTSAQSPDSRVFVMFAEQYNAISSGIVGMRAGEQKNISVRFKEKIETKTMSSEYLKKYKINASNLSAGQLFVGVYSEPNSTARSRMLGKVVSATADYVQVDYSYPDIHVTIIDIKNRSTNRSSSTLTGNQSPVIKRISPLSGPTSGGTLVTVTGTNLSGMHTINFGQSRVNTIRNVSDTTITLITPPAEPGVVSLYFQDQKWMGTFYGFLFTKREYTGSDNGKTFEVPRNAEFFVNVTESYAPGTKWHPRFSSGLEILDDEYVANPKSVRVDTGGTRSWKIRAAGTGQQTFQADFYPSDDSYKVQQHYALTFTIRPG